MNQQLALFNQHIDIATPRNCYHCARSDYSHWGKGKKDLMCLKNHRKPVRKLQRACADYRPMIGDAHRCGCTGCQKLLGRLEKC